MSRIAKKQIIIPDKVEVKLVGQEIKVKGPQGELSLTFPEVVLITLVDDSKAIKVQVADPSNLKQKALWGTFHRLITNLLIGVVSGFSKVLELQGVGYKVSSKGSGLDFQVGFSHNVLYPAPEGIKLEVKNNVITVSGIDKQLVGQVAAEIRAIKKPEPYKGKGIRYQDERVVRKAGKQLKAA